MVAHYHDDLACLLQKVSLRTDASRTHLKATETPEYPGHTDRLGRRQGMVWRRSRAIASLINPYRAVSVQRA